MVNIFFLDEDLKKAASYHFDIHLAKGVLEIGWLFYTARNVLGLQTDGFYNKKRFSKNGCTLWAIDSYENYYTLYRMSAALTEELKFRFNNINHSKMDHKTHVSIKKTIEEENVMEVKSYFKKIEFTPPYQAMGDKYKQIPEEFVKAYRLYYFYGKRFSLPHIGWTKRSIPYWYNDDYFNRIDYKPKDIFDLYTQIKE